MRSLNIKNIKQIKNILEQLLSTISLKSKKEFRIEEEQILKRYENIEFLVNLLDNRNMKR